MSEAFVKQYLTEHPGSTPAKVIEAWAATGNDGTISGSLVRLVRSKLGQSAKLATVKVKTTGAGRGRPRSATKTTPKVKGRKPIKISVAEVVEVESVKPTRGRRKGKVSRLSQRVQPTQGRTDHRLEIESDIDRLLFKVMELGGMTHIEDQLRKSRRSLYEGK